MGGGSGKKQQLGKILLRRKLMSADDLESLLDVQRTEPGHRLASTAERSGRLASVDLLKALSEQHGLPGIDLSQVVVPLDNLELIPSEIARQHLILPILVKEDRIFLAMADPADRRVIDEIEFVTGRRVFPYVALHDSLTEVIGEAYPLAERGEPYYVGANVPSDYLRSLGLLEGARDSSPPEPDPNDEHSGVVLEAGLGRSPFPGAVDAPEPDARWEEDESWEDAETVVAEPKEDAPPGRRVLVVDDEVDIRRLLRRVLSEKGYEVLEAEGGNEALSLVRESVPDLIVLDAMLPEVHGFDICRRIKGSKRYGHIPIIMVSAIYRGWRFAEDLQQSYGVDAFLEKPFKIAEVLGWVDRLLGRSSAPSDAPDALSVEAGHSLEKGIEAYQAGDLDGAIEHLRQGIGVDPLSFKLHYHLGLLYGRRDDVFEAIHELETAVDLQPRHFSALKNLAVLYQRAGFKHKAIEMWERALGNAPDDETRRGIKDHLMSLL